MRRLIRLLAGRRANGERGAVLVLTAFLVMFVAIGMLALTVDIGNITYNRAELQNGADASSLALATNCANATATSTATCGVTSDLTDLAVKNANVADQSMTVLAPPSAKTCINDKGRQYVLDHGATTDLPACSDPSAESISDLSSCQPWPMTYSPDSVSYVEVTTQTKMKDGSSILPFHFAQLLSGEGSGSTSETCSRAAWGPAGSTGATLPVVMGICDWDNTTNGGENYAPEPPYDNPPGTVDSPALDLPTNVPDEDVIAIYTHTTDDDDKCVGHPGLTYPGGFGWLAGDGECNAVINAGGWVDGDGGASLSNDCKNLLKTYLGQVVTVPIFDEYGIDPITGAKGYHIKGIAAFYFAGYKKVESAKPQTGSVYVDPGVCSGSKCGTGSVTYLWGWFTTGLLPIDATINPGGEDFGAEVVVPAG